MIAPIGKLNRQIAKGRHYACAGERHPRVRTGSVRRNRPEAANSDLIVAGDRRVPAV